MPTALPQMFEQAMDAIKGWYDASSLTKTARLADALLDSATDIPAGRVAHLNSVGEWELGGSGHEMPCFLWQGKNNADVTNNGQSPVTGVDHWFPILPAGYMNGLVCSGGFELQTTEFDQDQDYACNDLLTCDGDGIITNAGSPAAYTDYIVGIASLHVGQEYQSAAPTGPVGQNYNGATVLSFWSYFLPASA